MPSLLPIGGAIRLNPSAGGAATAVPLQDGGFAAVYRVANGPDVLRLFDQNFQPVSIPIVVTSDDFLAPQATALNDGRFIIAWLAQDQTIQGQIYNPDGTVSGNQMTLVRPTDASVGLSAPKIVGNAFGGFTTIWQDNATINGVTGAVFIQSFDGDGNLVGDPIIVTPPTVGPSDHATITDFRIAVLGDGTTVVAAMVQINGVDSIMYSVNGGQLISLAGGDPNFVYINPQITPLAAGGFVITYDFVDPTLVGTDSPDANWTTGGSVFTNHGTRHDFAVGTTVTTSATGTFAVDPSVITPLADGGFVVTFEPLKSPLGDGYLIDAQQFDAFGNAVGPVVLVAPQGFLPNVATSANGIVLDTYQFGSAIFLQAYNSAPTPLGPEPIGTSFGLNSVVSANSPGVAPLSTGGFVVVYQGASGDSWAQIYGINRQPVGAPFLVAATGIQPVVASQVNGTFLVAWSTGTQILGAVYDNQGNLLNGPFSMSGDPSSLPLVDPAINPTTSGGYSMAYETDLQSGGAHQVTIQVFNGSGNPIGTSVSQTYTPTNPLAPPRIAALEQQLFGSVTVIGVGSAIFAAIVSDPPTGGGNAGVAGQQVSVTSHAQPAPNVVQVSGANDGASRAGAQVATIDNGDIVVVWSEAPAGIATWQIVGQILTPAGVLVGNPFSIGTALPTNASAAQIGLSALPDGGFLVTYDPGNQAFASQRFDSAGVAIGGPVLVTAPGQTNVLTTMLSDGSLLVLSSDTPAAGGAPGGSVSGATFSVPAIPMNWTGSNSTDLGLAGNWDVGVAPDTGHIMQFGLANGGALTGNASAQSATFTGQGSWVFSSGTIGLTQGLTEQSALRLSSGSLTGGGTAAIGAAGGAMMVASGAAQVSFQTTAIGTAAGQTGTLTLSGAGTSWTDTGSGGAGGLQAGASTGVQAGFGSVSVSQGAHLTGVDADRFGLTAGSEGDLTVTSGGIVSNAGLILGQAGTGVATVNGGTISGTGALALGVSASARGTLTVSGTSSVVTGFGPATVGDAGQGALMIQSGGAVFTTGTTISGLAGMVIANTASASGSSVNVSGTGSTLGVGGLLDVGVAGSGSLQLSGGATVSAGSFDAGNIASAVGQIGITGSGTSLNITGAAIVADDGTGVLSVLSGATFAATSLTIGNTGNSSGAVVVSGNGSVINLSGALNIGTALGTGDLTVGPGAAVHASVVNQQGQVVLEGGLLDPTVNVINQGDTVSGFGTILAGDIIDEGVVAAGGSNASQQLLIVQGTVLGGGTLTINGTVKPSSAAGLLRINNGGTLELTGAVLNAPSTTFTDDLAQQSTYTVNNSVVDVSFSTASGELLLDDIAEFAGTISAYQPGDMFVITGGTLSNLGVINGTTLTVQDSGVGAGAGGIDRIMFASAIDPASLSIVNGNTIVACFAAGTRIATTHGLVPVESISAGDRVSTVLRGDTAEVIWTGHRKIDCSRHADPHKVWPVVISAHAFGRGMPATDLMLSPDHAVFVDGVLIPVRLLVNGRSVRQVLVDRVSYHHIELAHHDVVLANGMPAESYLDTGDRSRFSNGGEVVALHPDFSARAWEMHGCAPLVQTGPVLAEVRRRLGADVARRTRRERGTSSPGTTRPG